MDRLTKKRRSWLMSRVRSRDSIPERTVRTMLFIRGYRYRLHVKSLPGKPDIVFSRKKKIVFVHGCFWHGHKGCSKARLPKSNIAFWERKITANHARDALVNSTLRAEGWSVITVWQCQIKHRAKLLIRLKKFLGPA